MAARAHPRSRGENFASTVPMVLAGGSSPLTRGKPGQARKCLEGVRLIPAHAGKTARLTCSPWAGWAHPRSRGENSTGSLPDEGLEGSSPLTRGKRARYRSCTLGARLIPAHAGKTCRLTVTVLSETAHPRSRGENQRSTTFPLPRAGSSPLTRGKLLGVGANGMSWRLIPAHAGKTDIVAQFASTMRAHPRSRGENQEIVGLDGVYRGSSPLTRGKLRSAATARMSAGLIPAHAGKTSVLVPLVPLLQAHPRSRGENLIGAVRTLVVTGSSPLTRGKRRPSIARTSSTGLIPAHAGKTGVATMVGRSRPAHPRSRGENGRARSRVTGRVGSSPLTRGKHGCGG